MKNQVISQSLHTDSTQQRDPLGLTPLPAESRERFLRFTLAQKNTLLAPLAQILEVMQLPVSTVLPVPHMPNSVLGICSWQGKTLWLVDLNTLVGFNPLFAPFSESPSGPRAVRSQRLSPPIVIVVQNKVNASFGETSPAASLGLVVEQVGDVDLIDPVTIQNQSGLCPPALEPFVLGHCPQTHTQDGGTVLNISAIVNSFRRCSSC